MSTSTAGVDVRMVGSVKNIVIAVDALMAREGGARELWTHDSRFVGVPGMKVHGPVSSIA